MINALSLRIKSPLASPGFLGGGEEAGQDGGGLLPFGCGRFQPALTGFGELVEFGATDVLGGAPTRTNEAFLLEFEEGRVERAVVQLQLVAAGLLDAARQAVAVQRT